MFVFDIMQIRKVGCLYWHFNYDAPGQTGLFPQRYFEYLCLTSFFPSVFTSHSASKSQVPEVSKIVL